MKPRILIVEDEPFMARAIAQQVIELGYDHLGTTAYGEEAIILAGKMEFDLALVDLRLAGQMDGIHTAISLRERFARASILITSSPDPKLIERALEARPYGYLVKPFALHELHLVIAMALQRLETEATLLQREEQHETVLRTSMDSFWVVDLDGQILDVNEAACRMTGYDRAELLKMRIVDLEQGRTLPQIAEGIKQVLSLGSVQMEREVRRKDGQIRLIEMSVTCSPRRRLFCFGRDITERRRSEQTLKQSERHLRATLDSIPDAAFMKDARGRYRAVNASWCKTYEQVENNVIGKTDDEIFPPEQADLYRIRDECVRRSLIPLHVEAEHRNKHGAKIWLEVHKTPLLDTENSYNGLVGISRDITERRKSETRLQLLKRAVEQSPASIVITNPEGAIEYVNPYFEKHTGYTAQEAIGLNPRVLNSGEHSPEFFKNLWSTISAGNEWRGEIRNRRKDGSKFWEQASISPMRDENGQIVNYVAVKEDISERKATEHAMAWQAALVENSTDICCVKDLNLRVLAANQAMARAAGVDSPDQLVGKTDAEIFGKFGNAVVVQGYMEDERSVQRLSPGQCMVRHERMPANENSERYLLTRKFPVFDRGGKLIATANISTDITETKQAEHQLIHAKDEAEAANRAKSAFLAMMSHELRTPLNVINGMSSLLAQENWPPEHQHAIDLIAEGGNNLLHIIEELLEYSGLQAGKTTLEETPFALPSVVSSALRLCAASAQSKGLGLTYWLDPNTPVESLGDPRRLKQVLINLLNNAVKFTETGRVHLRVAVKASSQDAHTIEFTIADSGIGISADSLEKLFRPFAQADNSITRRFGGTGLGLAITKSFVNLMEGEIRVRSRLHFGSVFQFHIKLKPTANRTLVFSTLAEPKLRQRRVLVLGENRAQQRMLSTQLRDWGMQPTTLPPVDSIADSAYPAKDYDLAILPLQPVNKPGAPLAKWLAQQGCGAKLPIVWLGDNSTSPPACCTAPSVHLGPFIDPVALSQALAELLTTATPCSTQRSNKAEKPRPFAELLPLSILAAEDNATNREVIKLVLRHLGYKVDLVENGAEAVAAVQNKKYDLLLLDMQMPVMDGLTAASEICRLIPEPTQRLKIVALTANALPGDRERCLAAGMDAYLTKPIVPADLIACLRHIFQASAQVPTKPTPPAPLANPAEPVWIDTVHLDTITGGLPPEQSLDTLRQLHETVCHDYTDTFPLLVECCELKDPARFAETIHGLKGCFMMIGWDQAGRLCADALALARKREFKEWTTFADKLSAAFTRSSEQMSKLLETRSTQLKRDASKNPALSAKDSASTP